MWFHLMFSFICCCCWKCLVFSDRKRRRVFILDLFAKLSYQKSLNTSSNVLSVEGVLVIRTVSFVKSLSKLSIQLDPSVTGTNSAAISFFSKLYQLIPANHGCAWISFYPLAPNRCVLSLCKHLVIKFLPASEMTTSGRNSN